MATDPIRSKVRPAKATDPRGALLYFTLRARRCRVGGWRQSDLGRGGLGPCSLTLVHLGLWWPCHDNLGTAVLVLRLKLRRWKAYRVLYFLCDHLGSLLEVSFQGFGFSPTSTFLRFWVRFSGDFSSQRPVACCELLNNGTRSSFKG